MDFGTWYGQITRQVDFHLRDRVQSIIQGSHSSSFRGRGEDFEFFQPYTLGDEPTHIDWKASERLEEGLLVRRRREERVLEVWMAVDLSASMFTGFSPESCKQRLLLNLMVVVGRSVLQQQDLLGVVGFDRSIRTVMAPFRSERTLINVLKMIWDLQPLSGQPTALLPVLQFFATHQGTSQPQKKRLLLVLSDFETQEDWLPAVQRLRAAHPIVPIFLQEMIPQQLLATAGRFTYHDVESGAEATVNPRAWLRLLQAEQRSQHERCLRQLETSGVKALFVSGETFSIDALLACVDEQRR